MSDELDFEDENPGVSSAAEVDAPNENPNELDCGKTTNDACEMRSDSKAISSETKEIKSAIGVVRPSEVQFDPGEVQSDNGEVQSDPGEVQSDPGEVQSDTGEVQSDTGEVQSDTGEIDNENLEEGEINDNNPSAKQMSETTCRYFQRGTCFYGSNCRNRHISSMVYNMFDPVLSNRSNLEFQNNPMPPFIFPNPILLPDVETPWEVGIKKAKVIIQDSNFRKKHNDSDDNIENDWERCLEEAKRLQRSFQRQNCDVEKPHNDSRYCEKSQLIEKDPALKMKPESETRDRFHRKTSEEGYFKFKKEHSNYEKKTKPNAKDTPDHLKWIDPWQRSKSPKKRNRSTSFSISPSPPLKSFRKRSESTSSSSSRCDYRRHHNVKSPKRSTSGSVSPRSKRSNTTQSFSRSTSRSASRSLSISPRKRTYSRSYSSSRSSSVSSEDSYRNSRYTSKLNKQYQKGNNSSSDAFNKPPKVLDCSYSKKICSPERKRSSIHCDISTKYNLVKTSTAQPGLTNKPVGLLSKPPSVEKLANRKPSLAVMELLKYHSSGSTALSTQSTKEKAIINLPKTDNITSGSNIPNSPPETNKLTPFNITSNQHSSVPKIPCEVPKASKTGNKRDLLLKQLQAIEEAISRKKQSTK